MKTKKYLLLMTILLCSIFVFCACGNKKNKTKEDPNVKKYSVEFDVECEANLLFSKYDVDVYVDDEKIGVIEHGDSAILTEKLTEDVHSIRFAEKGCSEPDGKIDFKVKKDMIIKLLIHCAHDRISIYDLTEKDEEQDEEKITDVETPGEEEKTTESQKNPELPFPYTTNGEDTYKNGDSGKYAYYKSGSYKIYYIIDFDEGYVYRFIDGNGDETADKVTIKSGTLNDTLIITYHDGEIEWSEGLCFLFKEHPDKLCVSSEDGYNDTFRSTDLNNALKLLKTKTIYDR